MRKSNFKSKNIFLILIISIIFIFYGCGDNSSDKLELPQSSQVPDYNIPLSNPTDTDISLHLPEASGKITLGNSDVLIDASNSRLGYIMVKSLNSSKNLKVSISKNDDEYIYDLNNYDDYDVFPLQLGNGVYSVKVYENVSGETYTQIYENELDVEMPDVNSVFVYPSQYIWYKNGDKAIDLSNEICAGLTDEKEKIQAVYNFVIDYMEYDDEKAATVQKGYIPDISEILELKKGICFDYSALFAAMLRAQNIPVELVIGYVEPEGIYHAWNQAYVNGAWYFFDSTFGPSDHHSSDDYLKDRYY